MYGIRLPDGLRDNQKLPQAIITPTSKAFDGGHDEPLSPPNPVAGPADGRTMGNRSRYALALFERGQERAAERGLILVDTKYEFGTDKDGRIVLADEIHTPDSSRYWIAESYAAELRHRRAAEELRQGFRPRLGHRALRSLQGPDPGNSGRPRRTDVAVYIEAYETITGQRFVAGSFRRHRSGSYPQNLAPYFTNRSNIRYFER